jgi:5-methylcytosine-specific restriction endonuclease McrA
MAARKGDVRGTNRWKEVRKVVLSRDNYACFYCGADATTVDHVVPVSKTDRLTALDDNNLVACCVRCNSAKGSRSQAVFLARSSTPPAFLERLSPITKSNVLSGPCVGQTPQDVNGK